MAKDDEAVGSEGPADRGSRRANPIDVHVGSRVRLRRMLLGISQEKLGERLGLTFQQVQKYEKGVNRIGASRLFDLARVLGVSIEYFYEDAPSLTGGVMDAVTPGMAERPSDGYMFEFLNTREGLELNRLSPRSPIPRRAGPWSIWCARWPTRTSRRAAAGSERRHRQAACQAPRRGLRATRRCA